MSHLVNFMGSDTVEGVRFANRYYGAKGGMAGFSIPAAEHSTITAWGKARERESYANMVTQFAKPGGLVAVVSDSYDLYNAIERLWCGDLLRQVKESGATVVIRPDSGKPSEVVLKVLQLLDAKLGCTTNTKGYKVLPSYYRVIQGDGVNQTSIDDILTTIEDAGFSATNVGFGMGGALLQQVDRDTQKFAYKCSAVRMNGQWTDVRKNPITDPGKASKGGRLDLRRSNGGGGLFTTTMNLAAEHAGSSTSVLDLVYEDGQMRTPTTLDDVRERANSSLRAEGL
jgi:nicotinamide phosphoribosyltransferase